MKKNTAAMIADIVLLVLCAALMLGVRLVFHACGPKEDGSWMTCHWAEMSVFALSIAMTVTALARLLVRDEGMRRGMALALVPFAGAAAVLPQGVVRLCMMQDMRCHAVMRPAVIVFAVLIAVAAVVCTVLRRGEKAAR